MKNRRARHLWTFCAAAFVAAAGSIPVKSDGALAQQAGGSGYSGTLSTNRAIRRQQLTCDPPPSSGSTSVEYDPSLVTLVTYQFGPGYSSRGEPGTPVGFVEVIDGQQNRRLMDINVFLFDPPPGLSETGYVQFAFQLAPEEGPPGRMDPPPGFDIVARNPGVTDPDGVDTHAFQFELRPNLPLETIAPYRIFAAPADTHSGNAADGLTGEGPGGPFTLGPAQLVEVKLAGPFPEPSSLAVMGMGAVGLLRRRRRGK